MRQVQITEFGGPEVLKVVDVDAPTPGPGQVLVQVAAAGVNPIDAVIRQGHFPPAGRDLPMGAGLDAAGTVRAVGEGVEDAKVGDVVFGAAIGGAYAEQALLRAWAHVPAGVDAVEAGGWPTVVATAVRALDVIDAKAGETVVVSGASGGVGTAAVQIAKARGLTVVGIAGPDNQEYVRELGAIPVVYGEGVEDRVREAAGGHVDAGVDLSGRGTLNMLVDLTGDAKRTVTVIDEETAQKLGSHSNHGNPNAVAAYREAAGIEGFRVPVARKFSLDDAPAAQEQAGSGHNRGKNVIVP